MKISEQCGRWSRHACMTMLFLIPGNVTSELPIALLPTLIRWWAPEVSRCWVEMVQMEAMEARSALSGKQQVTWTQDRSRWCLIWLRRLSVPVSQWCGLGRLQSIQEDSAGALSLFRALAASTVWRMCDGAAPDIHSRPPRVDRELVAPSLCCKTPSMK